MDKIVLLVVDVQTSLVEEHPYKEKEVLANIGQLITYAEADR
jgi:nicotinamidase-related amidase